MRDLTNIEVEEVSGGLGPIASVGAGIAIGGAIAGISEARNPNSCAASIAVATGYGAVSGGFGGAVGLMRTVSGIFTGGGIAIVTGVTANSRTQMCSRG